MNFILWVLVFVLGITFLLSLFGGSKLPEEDIKLNTPDDFSRAKLAYEQAQQNFDNADPQYIDIAIGELGASENRVNVEIGRLKRGETNA